MKLPLFLRPVDFAARYPALSFAVPALTFLLLS